MRSRFTAFVRGDRAYLLSSWHTSTRPASPDPDDQPRWHSLRALRTEDGGPVMTGLVEFLAEGRAHGRPVQLHEVSRFVREHGRWQYLDGRIIPADRPTARRQNRPQPPLPPRQRPQVQKCCAADRASLKAGPGRDRPPWSRVRPPLLPRQLFPPVPCPCPATISGDPGSVRRRSRLYRLHTRQPTGSHGPHRGGDARPGLADRIAAGNALLADRAGRRPEPGPAARPGARGGHGARLCRRRIGGRGQRRGPALRPHRRRPSPS